MTDLLTPSRRRGAAGVGTRWLRLPDPAPGSTSRYLLPAVMGLVGTILIAVAASLPGAPFADKVPGAWFFGVPSTDISGLVAQSSGVLLFVELACGFGGLLLLLRSWLAITRGVARAAPVQPARLARIMGLWSVPILVAPPLFSNDIYSYAAQGEMVGLHVSPYVYGPGVLGATPFESLAQGYWINTPSPYGPLFTGLEGDIVRATGYNVLVSLVLIRLLAVAGVVLAAIFLPSLARSYGRDPGTAFALGLLNPLVLLFLIGSGHNDALMIGLLVAGLSMARRNHLYLAIVLCSLAGAVKAPALLGVAAVAWSYPGTASLRQRTFTLATSGVVCLATFEVVALLFGGGWGWIHTLGATTDFGNWITPSDLLAIATSHLAGGVFHAQLSVAAVSGPAHVVGLALAAVVTLWALSQLPRIGLPTALGISFLAIVLLGPSVQPWYLVWGIVFLALAGGGGNTASIIALTAAGSFLGLVGLHLLASDVASLGVTLILLLLLVLAAAAIAPVEALPPRRPALARPKAVGMAVTSP